MLKPILRTLRKHAAITAQTLGSLAAVLLFSRLTSPARKPLNGRSCFVFGNGPSFKEDVQKLLPMPEGSVTFCVNDFVQSDLFEQIKPSHYVLLDPYYFGDNVSEHMEGVRKAVFGGIEAKTAWPLTLWVPYDTRKTRFCRQLRFENPHVRIEYFNRTPIEGYRWIRHPLYHRNLGMPLPQNVLVAATFLALNQGFERVAVLGADHSWHEEIMVGSDNVLYLRDRHFYDTGTPKPMALLNHYQALLGHEFRIHDFFMALAKMFRGYIQIEDYARTIGAKVVNASSHSYIDAFERVNLDQAHLHAN